MTKFPKARTVGFSLLFFLAVSLNGCCSCKERYAPFLTQIEENLRDDVAPKYDAALKAQGVPNDVRENRVGLVVDSADSIKRVRTGGIAVWTPEGGVE